MPVIQTTDLDPFTLGVWVVKLGNTIQTNSSLFISSPDFIEGMVRTLEVCSNGLDVRRRDIARGTHDGSNSNGPGIRRST